MHLPCRRYILKVQNMSHWWYHPGNQEECNHLHFQHHSCYYFLTWTSHNFFSPQPGAYNTPSLQCLSLKTLNIPKVNICAALYRQVTLHYVNWGHHPSSSLWFTNLEHWSVLLRAVSFHPTFSAPIKPEQNKNNHICSEIKYIQCSVNHSVIFLQAN